MSLKVIVFAAVIAGVFGVPCCANSRYNFNYKVEDAKTGINLGHEASREGNNTQGSYFVLLPDSRLQKVTYVVNDDSGFVAQVSYEGEARVPDEAAPTGYYHTQ